MECQQCRDIFINTFCMPKALWSPSIRNSNGYFGCEATYDTNSVAGFNTWAYFEIKHLEPKPEEPKLNYDWSKANTFTRRITNTNQTALIYFNPTPRLTQTPDLKDCPEILKDPFWPYAHILEEITKLQDAAVWSIRDHVRDLEKAEKPPGRPQPNYRRLHDIGRHAIHVTESLDVAERTIEQILKHHQRYSHKPPPSLIAEHDDDPTAADGIGISSSGGAGTGTSTPHRRPLSQSTFFQVQSQLEFTQSCLTSLRHRSTANEKRLANEIQLAFNTVAQHDASLSVKISHAMMSDSTALKTLAFVTFVFLPPTYISSLFSMTFFQVVDGKGFTVSREFWIYWAIALPVTIVSTLIWQFWHKISPKERRERPIRNAVTFELKDLV
ncbi:hypothetical protein N7533_001708 [Penicillium manginii]|uniref:uncharacterized protein n=1 Tax=Penicillium manginii TaxID=203109 RepID=UPI002549344E|nr:uncharacterized protein N7533_001708 [Penicillium manginii]KAJ5763027.1 hypothetical protein N7533_001708 [Penicillium manginii]